MDEEDYAAVPQTDETIFSVYEAHGLNYDTAKGALLYEGKRVRLFWDSRNVSAQPDDSEKPFHDSVSNWDAAGEIDLYAVRNYDQTDENGCGTLIGFRVATEEEFKADTKLFSQQSQAVETAR